MPPARRDAPLVLLIDDDPDLREVIQVQLQALGIRVVVAADGFEGLDELERSCPDVVLCDLAMPGMDGLEFAARMRADRRFRGVPLIAVTGLKRQTDVLHTWSAGFDGHVDKPVTADVLVRVVKRFTGQVVVPSGREAV